MKTFKGLMSNNEIKTVRLSTKQGLVGYSIKKFQAISQNITSTSVEAVLQVFSVEPSSASNTINMDEPTLLAVIYFNSASAVPNRITDTIIIDNKKINQDIYVTLKCGDNEDNVNFYLELEQFKLSKDEATVATLKDMRGRE